MDIEPSEPKLVLPGQIVASKNCNYNPTDFLATKQSLLSVAMGCLSVEESPTGTNLQLQKFQNIYNPQKGDLVIGTIKGKTAEYYIMDINGPLDATLGSLEFDGVTKKNKPNLSVGAIVFCRITEYNRFTGAKLSCINKGFNTNNQLAELKGGVTVSAPKYKHFLLEKKLEWIGNHVKYEIVFGKNELIYLNTKNIENLMILVNLVTQILDQASEELLAQIVSMFKQ